ncbi:MAG: hypothetical protein ACLGG0_07200 [Bacteriovoracia bacterium]
MKRFATLVLTNLLVITSAWATTFQPVPLDKLIAPADAIMLGDFLQSKSVELEDGMIVTEARFKIDKEIGLDAEDFGLTEVKVYYPGGKLKERSSFIEGTPSFVPGEKNVLLLTQGQDGRLWVQGLAMGTFKVVRIGKQTVLINPVFPSHPELSRIEMSKFMRKVSSIKEKPLKEIYSDKYIRENEKDRTRTVATEEGNSRSIASNSDKRENTKEPNLMNSFWLLMILGFLGAFAGWWRRGKTR